MIMFGAKLEGVNLRGVSFDGTDLMFAYVDGPDWITKLKELNCNGVENIEKEYQVITRENDGKKVYQLENKNQRINTI